MSWKASRPAWCEIAKGQSRAGQKREQQTRTVGRPDLQHRRRILVVAFAILTALPEFGFDVTPLEAVAAVASLALGFGAQGLVKD